MSGAVVQIFCFSSLLFMLQHRNKLKKMCQNTIRSKQKDCRMTDIMFTQQ